MSDSSFARRIESTRPTKSWRQEWRAQRRPARCVMWPSCTACKPPVRVGAGSPPMLKRALQALVDRLPNGPFTPRVPVTVRLTLDDLAEILPPAEQRLLAHLRARR